jgi:hypothetical protein
MWVTNSGANFVTKLAASDGTLLGNFCSCALVWAIFEFTRYCSPLFRGPRPKALTVRSTVVYDTTRSTG